MLDDLPVITGFAIAGLLFGWAVTGHVWLLVSVILIVGVWAWIEWG